MANAGDIVQHIFAGELTEMRVNRTELKVSQSFKIRHRCG